MLHIRKFVWLILSMGLLLLVSFFYIVRSPSSPQPPSAALDLLIAALKTGNETNVRQASSARGLSSLQFGARGYVEGYRALSTKFSAFRSHVSASDWVYTDQTHATAGVSWHGGSGKHTDELFMVRTADGWTLAEYQQIWDR